MNPTMKAKFDEARKNKPEYNRIITKNTYHNEISRSISYS